MTTDICILGAGLAGLSLSDSLLEADVSSIVIEKNDLASGASGTPGGLVNPATGRRASKVWKAEGCYEAIANNLNKIQEYSPTAFYQNNGLLRPALLKKMARKMKEQYRETSWPEGWCQWKNKEEIEEIHPGIKCIDGGLWLPIGLSVDVGKFIAAYASYLSDQGVKIILNEDPYIIKKDASWQVDLHNSSIRCKQLVFATGHNSCTSPYWDWLPFNLIKGQVAKFKTSDGHLSFSHSISSLGYMARTGDKDTFVQGSTYEHDFQNLKPDAKGEQYLRKRMRRTLPQLEKKVTVVDQWAGVRTSTPDYKPILGNHPVHKTMHLYTGLGSKGLLYSKFLANHYVEHLLDDTSLFDKVDINRFL